MIAPVYRKKQKEEKKKIMKRDKPRGEK